MTSSDLLIVGAGPVGLTLALECCRQQIDFRIIDHHPVHSDKSKALVIWSGTLECLAALGVVEQFLEKGLPVRRFVLAAHGKILNEISVNQKIDSPYPTPLFLPQSETEEILERHLESLGKKVERSVDFISFSSQEDHELVTLRHADNREEILRVKRLAACDGARSLIRHALPVQFEGATESLSFVLIDAKVEGTFPRDGMFTSWGNGYTVIFFPVKPGVFRMFTQRRDRTNKLPPTLEEMQHYLSLVGLSHLRFYEPEWLSYFDINERVASRNRVGRIFLLGDAAHIHSPAGGQGMNTGMQDAFNLGWKMKFLTRAQGDVELIAESYFQERHPIAQQLVSETTKLLHIGVANTLLARLAKYFMAGVVLRLPFLQKLFCEKLSEMNIHYPASDLLEQGAIHKNKKRNDQVGWRVYEAFVSDPQTQQRVSLWKKLLHPGHTLLIFTGTAGDELSDLCIQKMLAHDAFSKTDMHVLVISPSAGAHVDFLDPNQEAHQRFGITQPSWLLVRPDLYVAARGSLDETTALEKYWSKLSRRVAASEV